MSKLPRKLQAKLWSSHLRNVDITRDKTMIIHKILAYGTMDDVHWLVDEYGKKELRDSFLTSPMNVYTRSALNFAKNMILGLDNIKIDESKYVKTLFQDKRKPRL